MSTAARLSWTCPTCGTGLAIRRNRKERSYFLGCTAFPACRFTEPYEPRLQDALQSLVVHKVQEETLRQRMLDELRALIFLSHPDRCQGNPVAQELTAALNDLRHRLRKGAI
jgi:ssDNA-binding Zn-finger/Zn-ribbon topoisomerase 1